MLACSKTKTRRSNPLGVKVRLHNNAYFVFINHQKQRRAIGGFGKDKRAAENFASEARVMLLKGVVPEGRHHAAPTFQQFAETWLETHAAQVCKATTVRGYSDNIKLHLVPALGDKPLTGISRADVKAMLKACRDKELSAKSMSNIVRTLSTILTEAMEQGLVPSNPAFRLGRYCARPDVPKFQIDPLTREECRALLDTARTKLPYQHYVFLLTALRTGMRLGELLALQWGDIDFHGRFIHVQRNLVRGVVTSPKNHRTRRVDMTPQLAGELRHLLTARQETRLKKGWPELPTWVFCTRDGLALDAANARHQAFDPALKKAELRRIRFHDLRHTYASLLLQDGAPITYVKDQLGHASIKVTVDVYGHLVPGANRSWAERLDDTRPDATPAQPTPEAAGEATPQVVERGGSSGWIRTSNPPVNS